jgi:hypothetical protein
MAKIETPAARTAVQMLTELDVEQLETRSAELQKELDALHVLIKAARIARDGKSARKKPVRKNAKADSGGGAQPVDVAPAPPGLKGKIVAALRTLGRARLITIAEKVDTNQDVVERILKGDDAFEMNGPGWWQNA